MHLYLSITKEQLTSVYIIIFAFNINIKVIHVFVLYTCMRFVKLTKITFYFDLQCLNFVTFRGTRGDTILQ